MNDACKHGWLCEGREAASGTDRADAVSTPWWPSASKASVLPQPKIQTLMSEKSETPSPGTSTAIVVHQPEMSGEDRPKYIQMKKKDGWGAEYCNLCLKWVDAWHLQSRKHLARREWAEWYGDPVESESTAPPSDTSPAPTAACDVASSTSTATKSGTFLTVSRAVTQGDTETMLYTERECEIHRELERFLAQWEENMTEPTSAPVKSTSQRTPPSVSLTSLAGEKDSVYAKVQQWPQEAGSDPTECKVGSDLWALAVYSGMYAGTDTGNPKVADEVHHV